MSTVAVQGDVKPEQGGRALARPRFELIPLRNLSSQVELLPAGTRVSVTCSPKLGLDRTLDTAIALAGRGLDVVPHVAARLVRDRRHLTALLNRLTAAGLHEVFVVGGDATVATGGYANGLALLEDLRAIGPPRLRIGVPAYPEGHPSIGANALTTDLCAKEPLVDYAVTQICFEPSRIRNWLWELRGNGVRVPVVLGLPGPMDRRQLLGIALRIGIGDSARLLRKQRSFFGQLIRPSAYVPDELVWSLAPSIDDTALGLVGLHVNTFNAVEACLDWQYRMMQDFRGWYGLDEDDFAASTTAPEPAL